MNCLAPETGSLLFLTLTLRHLSKVITQKVKGRCRATGDQPDDRQRPGLKPHPEPQVSRALETNLAPKHSALVISLLMTHRRRIALCYKSFRADLGTIKPFAPRPKPPCPELEALRLSRSN